jgi:hypothetical protein
LTGKYITAQPFTQSDVQLINMVQLNLPDYPVKTRLQDNQQLIFDRIRKKYVVLTPEEWVRQHFLNYLINDLEYPRSLVRVESGLSVNNMGKRTDILVYDKKVRPYMLIECKAAHIALSHKAMEQLSLYNQTIKAQYLVLTNGLKHYCCCMDYETNSYKFQSGLPSYNIPL